MHDLGRNPEYPKRIFLENRQNSGIHAKAIIKVALSRSGGVVFRSIYMSG